MLKLTNKKYIRNQFHLESSDGAFTISVTSDWQMLILFMIHLRVKRKITTKESSIYFSIFQYVN
jgi:hypothetical protein